MFSRLNGQWELIGLPGNWIVKILELVQMESYVTGTLVVQINGGNASFQISGNHYGSNVTLGFLSPSQTGFTFRGQFEKDDPTTVTGQLSGSLSGDATLRKVLPN